MSTDQSQPFFKLRAIDIRPLIYEGRPSLLLRDPLKLTDKMIVVPQQIIPVLQLCDGVYDSQAMRAKLIIEHGMTVDQDVLDDFLTTLDDALLFENDRFAQERERALTEYRQAPHRPLTHAGETYPDDPDELRFLINGYLDAVDDVSADSGPGRGLLSPHIDYLRGGLVYAKVWKQAKNMVKDADLVVLLGTDHMGSENLISLTTQNYATPYGILPTDQNIVSALAEAIGPKAAFAAELHHRGEHSIELASVWLHHMRDGEPCELVPILCGSFQKFVEDGLDPKDDQTIKSVLDVIKRETASRNVIFVAAGDLAHVGPAFGDPPLDFAGRAKIKQADDELIDMMCAGDARGFFETIKRNSDRNNVCGTSPIYLAMHMMGQVQGEQIAYDRCPADEENTSIVSISGIVFK